jgi:hypothetical protein
MTDAERRQYLSESLFLSFVSYENERLGAYLKKLAAKGTHKGAQKATPKAATRGTPKGEKKGAGKRAKQGAKKTAPVGKRAK